QGRRRAHCAMETKLIMAKALEANGQLHLAQEQIGVAGEACRTGTPSADTLELAMKSLRAAQGGLDELLAELEAGIEIAPAMRECRACLRSIRAQATLCGYCWAKQ